MTTEIQEQPEAYHTMSDAWQQRARSRPKFLCALQIGVEGEARVCGRAWTADEGLQDYIVFNRMGRFCSVSRFILSTWTLSGIFLVESND